MAALSDSSVYIILQSELLSNA